MKIECSMPYLSINNKIVPYQEERYPFVGAVAYEVIRIMEGKSLFLHEHLERLSASIKRLSNHVLDQEKLVETVHLVIQANTLQHNNIKILVGNFKDGHYETVVFPIKSHYPDEKVYESGVETALLNKERGNPNAKVVNADLTKLVNEVKEQRQLFELLLVNDEDLITEGSRSNVFFIEEGRLITPPSKAVLMGITRMMVIQSAVTAGIEVLERTVHCDELPKFKGAFLTGTSLHLMPISCIGDICYKSSENEIFKQVNAAFLTKIKQSLLED